MQTPPRPGPRYLPEPEPEPPSPRAPGGYRLEIHLTARAGRPGPGAAAACRQRSQCGLARLGSAREPVGTAAAPGPPARDGRSRRGPRGLRRAGAGRRGSGPGKLGRGGGQVYIFFFFFPFYGPPFFPPPVPSFCYLDFFSCCVMSIIYAKSFAACCTALACRRGRAGRGGDLGARNQRWGRGRDPRPPAASGGPPRLAPGTGLEGGRGGSGGPPPARRRWGPFGFGRCARGAGARAGVRAGTLSHSPSSLGSGRDAAMPGGHLPLPAAVVRPSPRGKSSSRPFPSRRPGRLCEDGQGTRTSPCRRPAPSRCAPRSPPRGGRARSPPATPGAAAGCAVCRQLACLLVQEDKKMEKIDKSSVQWGKHNVRRGVVVVGRVWLARRLWKAGEGQGSEAVWARGKAEWRRVVDTQKAGGLGEPRGRGVRGAEPGGGRDALHPRRTWIPESRRPTGSLGCPPPPSGSAVRGAPELEGVQPQPSPDSAEEGRRGAAPGDSRPPHPLRKVRCCSLTPGPRSQTSPAGGPALRAPGPSACSFHLWVGRRCRCQI